MSEPIKPLLVWRINVFSQDRQQLDVKYVVARLKDKVDQIATHLSCNGKLIVQIEEPLPVYAYNLSFE